MIMAIVKMRGVWLLAAWGCMGTGGAWAAASGVDRVSMIAGAEGAANISVTDGSLLSYSDDHYAATAQSDFGVNRVYASATDATGGIGAASVWSDVFTVSGSSESWVTVTLSTLLSGRNEVIGGTVVDLDESGGEFDLLVYESPMSPEALLAQMDEPDNVAFIKVALDAPGVYSQVLSRTLTVRGGSSFYVAGVMALGADRNQVMDFAHSAHFGIQAGPGVALTTLSGVVYPSTVPEPGMGVLGLAGCLVLVWRKGQQRGTRSYASQRTAGMLASH